MINIQICKKCWGDKWNYSFEYLLQNGRMACDNLVCYDYDKIYKNHGIVNEDCSSDEDECLDCGGCTKAKSCQDREIENEVIALIEKVEKEDSHLQESSGTAHWISVFKVSDDMPVNLYKCPFELEHMLNE